MWLTILAVLAVAFFEHISLKAYRSFNTLPEKVKKYNFRILWISTAVIVVVLFIAAIGVPLPGLLWVK